MTGDRLRRQVAQIPSVRSHTATFVRMEDGFAVINTGDTQIRVPCPGYFPPQPGMSVQVEWRDGRPAVVGPAVTQNPIGEITGTGSPLATVTVDGVSYLLPYEDWYTPVVSDVVSVDWTRRVIVGKLSTSPTEPEAPEAPKPKSSPFDVSIQASGSGKWSKSNSNWFGGSEVWAGVTTDGVWVYGNRVRDGVGANSTVTRIWIHLPLISTVGDCLIGLHSHPGIPGGAPTITDTIALNPRGGWVELPVAWGTFLKAGGRGIGVGVSPGSGFTRWAGTPPDSWSGMLRIQGTR